MPPIKNFKADSNRNDLPDNGALLKRIRSRFERLGDVHLPQPPREAMRESLFTDWQGLLNAVAVEEDDNLIERAQRCTRREPFEGTEEWPGSEIFKVANCDLKRPHFPPSSSST